MSATVPAREAEGSAPKEISSVHARRARSFYGWKLVGGLWILDLLNIGLPLYCSSVINSYMLQQIPMPRSTFGLGYSLVNFFVGVPAILIATIILRWGIRTTLVIGAGLLFAGSLWLALVASTPWQYLVGFGGLIGCGVGFGTVMPISTAVTRWFTKYRGRALGISLTAWGVAGFVGAPLFNRFLDANGGNFRLAWLVVAASSLLSGALAWKFVVERPEDLGQRPDGAEENAGDAANRGDDRARVWTPAEAYRTPAFWMIFIASIGCQYPSFFFTAHGILHLKLSGLRAADAAWAMGLYTLGGLCGRLTGGILVDLIPERFAFMIGLSFYVVGTFLALQVDGQSLWIANAAAMLYGAGMGSAFICLNTITGNYFGPAAFPRLNGTMMMLSGLACAPAGVIGGWLFDHNQNYIPAFLLNFSLCAAGFVALCFAGAPRPREAAAPILAPTA